MFWVPATGVHVIGYDDAVLQFCVLIVDKHGWQQLAPVVRLETSCISQQCLYYLVSLCFQPSDVSMILNSLPTMDQSHIDDT
jgi:hypothetical protein